MSTSRLKDLLNLYRVPRWSLVTCLRPQSVAEHSFNVAAIALEICERLGWWSDALGRMRLYQVILWSVVHDGPEAETGDVPYPIKRMYDIKAKVDLAEAHLCPWYATHDVSMIGAERAIVKIADKVEEFLWLNRFGWGDEAAEAMNSAYQQVTQHVEAARSRYGWDRLSATVSAIVTEQLTGTAGPAGPTGSDSRRRASQPQSSEPEPQASGQGPGPVPRQPSPPPSSTEPPEVDR